MSRSRVFSLCVLPVLCSAHLVGDDRTLSPSADASAPDPAGERGVPALFSWADIDGDGRLDLAAVSSTGALQLLIHSGEGRFEDVTAHSHCSARVASSVGRSRARTS